MQTTLCCHHICLTYRYDSCQRSCQTWSTTSSAEDSRAVTQSERATGAYCMCDASWRKCKEGDIAMTGVRIVRRELCAAGFSDPQLTNTRHWPLWKGAEGKIWGRTLAGTMRIEMTSLMQWAVVLISLVH